ncbi:hypothetical protein SBA4_2000009 [Candidatus Sulfopaludibacter sp. SbA4]|nr:hypothetical protein SBA4_2000009 [Candidatus Sulfopaludibacter sp. SbA4]
MATKKPARAPKVLRSVPIVFRDIQIIAAAAAAGAKNPIGFPDEQGAYQNPDVIISGGTPTKPLPQNFSCVGSLVIYSSWADKVPNCAGFAGPGAGNNAVVTTALKNANAAAAQIPCAGDCKKTVTEIWRGWGCGNNPLTASGAVELKISCDLASPN